MFKVCYSNTIFRPEDYKMVDSNPESEDNKENVDLKEEEIAGKFLKYYDSYIIGYTYCVPRFYFPDSGLLIL
jgi:hypothetical protein